MTRPTLFPSDPFAVAPTGRIATAGGDAHVRQMIRQVLFTRPGERVNLPEFGCGLLALTFEPNSVGLAAATRFLVHGALERWLGDLIDVRDVRVDAQDSTLFVEVTYARRLDGRAVTERFVGGA
ncbi:MAG TPA: GPW/gp25 family protein [Candidatus Thermoplasmatota archaeon]|nr:GPW/gp25 family protein [Candidatus Thermoplasmatota archaeon]